MLFLLASLLFGCNASPNQGSLTQTVNGITLDPVFDDMFNYYGGTDLFGMPISRSWTAASVTTQFVESGKLIYDKSAKAKYLFRFAPIGSEIVLEEPPVPKPKDPGVYYINGHIIPPDFYKLYTKLGPDLVGKPLTDVRFNMIHNRRYEQFFENLGFYRIEDTSEVRLLAYGSWACKDECAVENKNDPATIDIQSYIDPLFQDFVKTVGADFTGFALTSLYQTQDGNWEQILENVVLDADSSENPKKISLKPFIRELGQTVDEPRPPSHKQGWYFYATNENGEGYDIPFQLWDYLYQKEADGIRLTGRPITHYSQLEEHVYHQCFENVCLKYDPNADEGTRVRPEPLGYAYKSLFYPACAIQFAEPTETTSPPAASGIPAPIDPGHGGRREVLLRIWESSQTLEKKQNQQIQVWVLDNNQPVVGKVVVLTVALPNSGDSVFEMSPTNDNGQTSITLPKIKAPNGTIVPYSACYTVSTELDVCVKDSFVIWDNP